MIFFAITHGRETEQICDQIIISGTMENIVPIN